MAPSSQGPWLSYDLLTLLSHWPLPLRIYRLVETDQKVNSIKEGQCQNGSGKQTKGGQRVCVCVFVCWGYFTEG